MREVRQETKNKGESLFRTMGTAMLIAGLICFVAMFWPLRQKAPDGADAGYYLPWCLSYGLANLLISGSGLAFSMLGKEKTNLYKPGAIAGIVCGGLLVLEGLPIAIVLSNVEFCVSVAVIGACVIALGALTLSSLKEENQ